MRRRNYRNPMNVQNSRAENTPFIRNITKDCLENTLPEQIFWQGKYLKVLLKNIKEGESSELVMYENSDVFVKIESGNGIIQMGKNEKLMNFKATVSQGYALLIPCNTYYNIINTGATDIKYYLTMSL